MTDWTEVGYEAGREFFHFTQGFMKGCRDAVDHAPNTRFDCEIGDLTMVFATIRLQKTLAQIGLTLERIHQHGLPDPAKRSPVRLTAERINHAGWCPYVVDPRDMCSCFDYHLNKPVAKP